MACGVVYTNKEYKNQNSDSKHMYFEQKRVFKYPPIAFETGTMVEHVCEAVAKKILARLFLFTRVPLGSNYKLVPSPKCGLLVYHYLRFASNSFKTSFFRLYLNSPHTFVETSAQRLRLNPRPITTQPLNIFYPPPLAFKHQSFHMCNTCVRLASSCTCEDSRTMGYQTQAVDFELVNSYTMCNNCGRFAFSCTCK